jgi:hypothetical protein
MQMYLEMLGLGVIYRIFLYLYSTLIVAVDVECGYIVETLFCE